MTLDKILPALTNLDLEDIKTVHQYCEVLLLSSPTNSSGDWLLSGIINELTDRGLSYTIPERFTVKNSQQFHGYARKAERIRDKLASGLGTPKKVELIVLGRRVAALLADYLQPYFNLSLDVMLSHIEQIPQAIEAAFPGYTQNGLLFMLLKPTKEWVD